jgi:hypothetical protein
MKMFNLFQSSVREQKQLIHRIEQQSANITVEKSASTTKRKSIPQHSAAVTTALVKKSNKPSLMKQPNTISSSNKSSASEETTRHRLTYKVEEEVSSTPLKQIMVHVKKALSLLANSDSSLLLLQQHLKPALNKITAICNSTRSITTTTTNSSEVVVVKKEKKRPISSTTTATPSKRINIADIHREIQRLVVR